MNAKKAVLVLDDEPGITRIIESIFTLKGFNVVKHNSPTEALGSTEVEQFDLVFVDMMMPEMSGIDFIEHAKQNQHHAQFVMLTAKRLDEEERKELFNLGVDIMTKPFKPHDLIGVAGRLLSQNT